MSLLLLSRNYETVTPHHQPDYETMLLTLSTFVIGVRAGFFLPHTGSPVFPIFWICRYGCYIFPQRSIKKKVAG